MLPLSESNLFFLNNGDGIFRQKSNWVGPAGTIDVIAKDARVEVLLQVGSVNLIFYSKGYAFTSYRISVVCLNMKKPEYGWIFCNELYKEKQLRRPEHQWEMRA